MSDINRQELAATLFEEAGDALFLFDPETEQLQDVNPMSQRLTGFTRQQLLQMKITYLFRAEAQGGMQRLRQAFRRTGMFHSQEGFWLRHQDEGVWTSVNLTITRLHTVPLPLGLITVRDITEQRETLARLKKMEGELRRVMSSVSDCLWSAEINDAGQWIYCFLSPVVEKITGRPPDFYRSSLETWLSTVHPEDLPRVTKAYQEMQSGLSRSEEYRVVLPNGDYRWIRDNVIATPTETGKPVLLDGVITDITDRRRADEALRESEARHRLLLEKMPAIVWTTDLEGRITSGLGAGLARLNLLPNQMVGTTLADYLQTSDPDFLPLLAQRRAVAGESFAYELDWQGYTWHSHVEPLRDREGRPIGVIGVSLDITDRKKAEQAVQAAEARYRELFENANDIIYTHDLEGNFTSINKTAERVLGYTRAEALALKMADIVPKDYQALARIHLQNKLAGTTGAAIFELEVICKDGRRLPLEINTRLISEANQVVGVQGIARDITERKRAEEEIRRINIFLDSIIENIPDMLFIKDAASLKFERLNKAAEKILGCRREDVVGKTDYEVFTPDEADFFVAKDREVLVGKTLLDIAEESVKTPQGERILHTKKIPLLDENGDSKYLLGISEDVTDRKKLEEQLRQSQKMEAIGQLAGGISHDFNNLLTAILGNVGLVMAELPIEHPSRELLADAEKAGRRAAELIRQLMGFSRRTLLRPEPLNLNSSIEETMRLLRRTIDPRITAEVRALPALWPVRADAGQMGQVLMNLCLNARDAMPAGGRLILETTNVTLDRESSRAHIESCPGDYVRLRVSDSGRGMSAEVKQHVFEPFFTTKKFGKGTGLGLAMVFGIVKQHGGWIEYQSEIDRGTCFDIFLPRLAAPPPAADPIPVLSGVRGGTETILIADDQDLIRRLAGDVLRRQGYQVVVADNGAEAVEIYRRRHHDIALVILDMVMPQMSGLDALHELRKIDPNVCIIISSGYSPDQEPAEYAGVAGYLPKPYRPVDLARGVREALDRQPRSAGNS